MRVFWNVNLTRVTKYEYIIFILDSKEKIEITAYFDDLL